MMKLIKMILLYGFLYPYGLQARNWKGAAHISPGARSFECEGQLKRWATVWLVEWQSGHLGHRPTQQSDGRTEAVSSHQI